MTEAEPNIERKSLRKMIGDDIGTVLLDFSYQQIPRVKLFETLESEKWVHDGNGASRIGGESTADHGLCVVYNTEYDDWP